MDLNAPLTASDFDALQKSQAEAASLLKFYNEELLRKDLASRLRMVRELRNLSQTELADLLNVSRASISQYEAGAAMPPLTRLAQVAIALRVPLVYFFSDSTHDLFDMHAAPSTDHTKREPALISKIRWFASQLQTPAAINHLFNTAKLLYQFEYNAVEPPSASTPADDLD